MQIRLPSRSTFIDGAFFVILFDHLLQRAVPIEPTPINRSISPVRQENFSGFAAQDGTSCSRMAVLRACKLHEWCSL